MRIVETPPRSTLEKIAKAELRKLANARRLKTISQNGGDTMTTHESERIRLEIDGPAAKLVMKPCRGDERRLAEMRGGFFARST